MEQSLHPAIPSNLAERKASGINWVYMLIGGIVLLIIGLMVYATMTTGAYYLTVDEVLDRTPEIYGERVRVNGIVVGDSEDWNVEESTLRFTVYDENDELGTGAQLPIVYVGPRPDNFQRAVSAIIEGTLLPSGEFKAQTLLLKCPSRYEESPEEIEEFLFEATG